MDRIQSFQVFARVAEMRSFTKAAESLGLVKASVSAQIQQLESELGTRLLHRTTRNVQLTHDGISFYERCKDFLADFDDIQTMFQEGTSGLGGRIRVDMPGRMARFQVIPYLHQFFSLHPHIEIELGSTDRAVDLVHEGYDCVIRVGDLTDSSIIAKKIGELEIISCASPLYLKTKGSPLSIDDLSHHYLVHYVSTFGEKPDGFEYFDGKEYRTTSMRGMVTVNNTESYVAACLEGLGIIQAPLMSLEKHLEQKRLIEVLPNFRSEPMPVFLLYPHQRNLPRRVKAFMNWLETVFKTRSESIRKY
jgi:DNA-binding transcriptional LysR family regulator